jgi:FtsH-binding integral membrane protein
METKGGLGYMVTLLALFIVFLVMQDIAKREAKTKESSPLLKAYVCAYIVLIIVVSVHLFYLILPFSTWLASSTFTIFFAGSIVGYTKLVDREREKQKKIETESL